MQAITRKEFLAILSLYLEKKIELRITGAIELQTDFEKVIYEVNEDILSLKDKNNNNYISINLNNINFMAKDENKLICNLNDNIDTIVEIVSQST